ncbi:LysM repeat protein [Desulfitispora alkaliphila]|uniref:LysM peptidoglycan-binding domain-containing protein n=1 Tax=Desulfitispora alkaliphila TaxID=622674 RepID=UPI003D2577D4
MENENQNDSMVFQATNCPGGILYAVRRGQTLFSISRLFSVTVDQIIEANPGIVPDRLTIGQVICIPGVVDRLCPRGRLRTVQRGETLFLIARAEGIPLNVLIEANFWLPDPTLIFPGEQICIPLIVTDACCLVLQRAVDANNLDFRGVSLIEPNDNGGRVTVAAVGLPEPSTFGDFNAYLGSLVFREIERLIPLERVSIDQQPVVWAGAIDVDVPPLGANLVVVFPYNTETDERGPDVLRGLVINCQPALN